MRAPMEDCTQSSCITVGYPYAVSDCSVDERPCVTVLLHQRSRRLNLFNQRLRCCHTRTTFHIKVRNQPNRIRSKSADQNTALLEPRHHTLRAHSTCQPEDHNIRLDRIDRKS